MFVDSKAQKYKLHNIPKAYLEKWQRLADVTAGIFDVPAALIMRVDPEQISVLVSSESQGNPYHLDEKADLNTGLYCETVMFKREKLEVPFAPDDPEWNENPDIALNMNSYLGFPLVWPNGEIFGTICVLDSEKRTFASKYIDLLEQFKDMIETDFQVINHNEALERSYKDLDAFAHTVSHDLKAPARRINLYADILLNGTTDKRNIEMLEKIRFNSYSINNIINDILVFSRSANKSIARTGVDVSSLAQKLYQEVSDDYPGRSVKFVVEPNCNAKTDPDLTKIVLSNLLNNALKYTGKNDETKISFGQMKRRGETVFYLKDNGIGFDQEHADAVFEPFTRLNSSSEFEGTGIGLATTKRIIERLEAKIWAESEPGKGTTFYFTL